LKPDKGINGFSLALRYDKALGVNVTLPFCVYKNLEVPIAGGWLVHRLYSGGIDFDFDSYRTDSGPSYKRIFGYQAGYSASASRWVDSYFGLGFEFLDADLDQGEEKFKPFFVSEVGLRFRVNVTYTPLKFLQIFGTKFWGIRIGWKQTGIHSFINNGFVIEIGAGAF